MASTTKDGVAEFFPPRTQPTQGQIDAVSLQLLVIPQSAVLKRAQNMGKVLALQTTARTQHGKRPFAAVLVGPDHESVLLMHQSVSHVEHAESSLARLSALHYSQGYLCKRIQQGGGSVMAGL